MEKGTLKHQSITRAQGLNSDQQHALRELARLCEAHDRVDLRINWGQLAARAGGDANNLVRCFLCYQDDALAGFLSMAIFGEDAEVSALVRPDLRRRGIFRALAAAAVEECRQQNIASLLFICDDQSSAGRSALAAIGASYEFSEHKMKLAPGAPNAADAGRITLQTATFDDAHTIATIIATGFAMDVEQIRQHILYGLQMKTRRYYIARTAGEPIGALNVDEIDGDAYIYGFVVRPEYRGRGYGREMLTHAVQVITAEGPRPVFLEVQPDNTAALSLYVSFGFTIITTFEYHRLKEIS